MLTSLPLNFAHGAGDTICECANENGTQNPSIGKLTCRYAATFKTMIPA
jgi:hypothetical protein